MPDEMELSELATLYKKGNVEDPANYRPISLLNTIYKIYAAILQKRLATGLDDKIWETQYGSRKKRSTTQLLFITRRLQDQAGTIDDICSRSSWTGKRLLTKLIKKNLSKLCTG